MYSRKKPLEDVPMEDTVVWSCSSDDCKGWMRDNFAFDNVPTCSLCQSPMVKSIKQLPHLHNSNTEREALAALKKQQEEQQQEEQQQE